VPAVRLVTGAYGLARLLMTAWSFLRQLGRVVR
jgi:hypothetical protein